MLLRCRRTPPIHSAPLRPVHGPKGVHKATGQPCGTPQTTGDSRPPLSRRPPDLVGLISKSSTRYESCHDVSSEPQVSDKRSQERTPPLSMHPLSGCDSGYPTHKGFPHSISNTENDSTGENLPTTPDSKPHASHSTSRPDGGQYGSSTVGKATLKGAPILPKALSNTNSTQGQSKAPSASRSPKQSSLVDKATQPDKRETSTGIHGGTSHDGCKLVRLGRNLERTLNTGTMVTTRNHVTNKRIGTPGNTSNPAALPITNRKL